MVGGVIILIIAVISIMTWFYPYSHLSINKNYTYQSKKVLFYNEILSEFKDIYEKDVNADLMNEYPNITINRTQFVLPIFEQDWLISNDSVTINAKKLETMLFEVKQVKEVMLSLVVQADYTSEQRGYLVDIIRNLILLEDSIIELKNENYITRSDLNRQLDNLYNRFISDFRLFISFYESALT